MATVYDDFTGNNRSSGGGFRNSAADYWSRGNSWAKNQWSGMGNRYRGSKMYNNWGPAGMSKMKGWTNSGFNSLNNGMSNRLIRYGGPIGLGMGAGLAMYSARRDRHSVDSSIVTGSLTALAVGGGVYGLMAKRDPIKKALLSGAEWMSAHMFKQT